MPKIVQHTLLSVRDLLVTTGPFALLSVALLIAAYWMLDPAPPQRVVLATGVEQGAYAEFGKRYAELLKPYGISVELRHTQGASENLSLLRDPNSGVDLGFVLGGADREHGAEENPDAALVSLGSMFFEPVWLFYSEKSAQRLLKSPRLNSLSQLAGWRVNIGAAGSGVPVLMNTLIEANKLDANALKLLQQPQTPAVVDLLEGRIDALVLASAPEALMVQMLLQTPGIALFDFAQAEAYSRRFAFMSPVVLPRGVVDLARDIPVQDVRLVASTATLLAKAATHPALIQLFVQAAEQVHGGSGWFQRKGDFPKGIDAERPLATDARRFYQSGPPFLQRYLPFWLANLIDRMWPVLVTIVAILLPLSRLLPPLYEFRVRSRVFRWYRRLREIDNAQGTRPADELMRELSELESRVEKVNVPLSIADKLYALRSHIKMVRSRLRAQATQTVEGGSR